MPISNLKIPQKVRLIVATAVLGLVVMVAGTLYVLKDDLIADRQVKTRHLVESAHSLIGHYQDLESQGKLGREEAQKQALDAVRALRYEKSEYFWINTMSHIMVMHPFSTKLVGTDVAPMQDKQGKNFFIEMVDTVRRNGGGYVFYYWPKPGVTEPVRKLSYVKGFAAWDWVVGSGIYLDDIDVIFRDRAIFYAVITLGLIGMVVGVGYVIGMDITKPLGALSDEMGKLAGGDTTIRVENAERGDEIGMLARALLIFKDNAIERGRIAHEREDEHRRKQERHERVDELTANFDRGVSALLQSVSVSARHLHEASQAMTAGAEQTSEQSSAVATAATRASENVQTVAAAAEELTASVGE
ncbi:MAG: methyl-accepting chemotaxis protein, partial [Rhodospirillales bacterium]|nr:methyl-accepting chemotaxis protein [Rhodospirillales bacterium]